MPVVDNREVEYAYEVSTVVRPNKERRSVDEKITIDEKTQEEIITHEETITYVTETTIRYELKDADGKLLDHKNITHESAETSKQLDTAELATIKGAVRPLIRADKISLSGFDIGE